jgi:hypothetical protein
VSVLITTLVEVLGSLGEKVVLHFGEEALLRALGESDGHNIDKWASGANPLLRLSVALSVAGLSHAEKGLLKRARDDAHWSVFPMLDRTEAVLEPVRDRAFAVGGDRFKHGFDFFSSDQVDMAGIAEPEHWARISGEVEQLVGRLRILCEQSSAAGILAAAKAQQICPIVEYDVIGSTTTEEMRYLLSHECEVLIIANAPYLVTSTEIVRRNYVPYTPLHKSYNHIVVKLNPTARFAPKVVNLRSIPETSAIEERRFKPLPDGMIFGSDVRGTTAHEIDSEMDSSEGLISWSPFTEKLEKLGFSTRVDGHYGTWISLYFRKDLAQPSLEAIRRRHAIVRLLAAAWTWITLSPFTRADTVLRSGSERHRLTNVRLPDLRSYPSIRGT